MKIKIPSLIKLILITILISGCATVGNDFSFTNPSKIKVGLTSKNDIMHTFGSPFRVGFDSGEEQWTYGYYKYRLIGDSDTKDLVVVFNSNGIVKSYSFNSSLEEDKMRILIK